jgi:hypothetical protein
MNHLLQYAENSGGRLVTIAQFGKYYLAARRARFCATSQPKDGCLVVEDDIEEGTVHVQPVVLVNKANLAEPIHENTAMRAIVNRYRPIFSPYNSGVERWGMPLTQAGGLITI